MVDINDDIQFMDIIGDVMTEVIDDVASWLLQKIQDTVQEEVYDAYPKGKMYKRLGKSGGFLGAWEKNTQKIVADYIESNIGFAPDRMIYDPEEHQHGSIVDGDRRKQMVDLIQSGSGYDFGGNAAEERPFWNLIEEVVQDGSLDFEIERAMTKRGLSWERII